VERHALAQLKVVGHPIRAFVPPGREAGRQMAVRHGFHQRIMQGPQAEIRRLQRPGLRRIKPRRRQGDVHRPGHLPGGGAFLRQGAVSGGPPVPQRPSGDATEGLLQKTRRDENRDPWRLDVMPLPPSTGARAIFYRCQGHSVFGEGLQIRPKMS